MGRNYPNATRHEIQYFAPVYVEISLSCPAELLAFTDVVKGVEPSSPLTELPNTHHPLIAKLVVESDKSLAILVKHIKKTILRKCGIQDDKKAVDDPRLPNTMLTRVVQSVATRVNYGPQDSPAAFTIWRWEVNEPEAMFPDVATDPICNVTNVSERRREREDARRVFKESFDALTEDQRKALLDKPKKNATTKAPSDNTPSGSPATKDKKPARKESPTKANPNEVEIIELQPVPKAPKARKEAQLMRNFFKGGTKEKGSEGREPPASPGDFTRVFKAFLPREDTLVAPANSFRQKGKGKERAEIIILEDDGDVEMVVQASENAGSGSSLGGTTQETNGPTKHNARELLHSFLASVPASRRRRKPRATNLSSPTKSTSSKVKTHSNVSVREIMTKLNEAELTGDVSRTRQLQQLLKNRRTVPLKFLQFCDNVRPGYYGTWTRSSPHVGPRTPFARDHVAFDYSYDSGEDWEEEPEDAEDVVSNGSDEEEETATLDGDDEFDDWLVGDDEVEFEGGIDPANPARSISPTLEPNRTGKRKHDVEKEKEKEAKKRRVFKPLVPYSCGPVWETRLGDCPDHLSGFRIQLLNGMWKRY
ncbi:hypothetical protein FRB99_006112 [Tulasnella sp. 403]|nr:hypothetical protein FRB99_006112 [Tulasnella sp. 403]